MIKTDCNSAKRANFRHTFNLPPKINGKRLSERRSAMKTDPTAEVSSVLCRAHVESVALEGRNKGASLVFWFDLVGV